MKGYTAPGGAPLAWLAKAKAGSSDSSQTLVKTVLSIAHGRFLQPIWRLSSSHMELRDSMILMDVHSFVILTHTLTHTLSHKVTHSFKLCIVISTYLHRLQSLNRTVIMCANASFSEFSPQNHSTYYHIEHSSRVCTDMHDLMHMQIRCDKIYSD